MDEMRRGRTGPDWEQGRRGAGATVTADDNSGWPGGQGEREGRRPGRPGLCPPAEKSRRWRRYDRRAGGVTPGVARGRGAPGARSGLGPSPTPDPLY